MRKRFALYLLVLLCTLPLQAKNFIVVIDPGHGGKDPGAVGFGGQEKDINLKVAQKLGALITEKYKDVTVMYTRTTDKYVTLKERPEMANKANADLFISIHTNAAESSSAYGCECWVRGVDKTTANLAVVQRENSVILMEDNYQEKYQGFDPKSTDSQIMFELMQDIYSRNNIKIAQSIQNELIKIKRHDRGVRQAGFWVLHQTKMPSLLVELGFITNSSEAKYMLSDAGQTALANAILKGFVEYKKFYDSTSGNKITMKATPNNQEVATNTKIEQPQTKKEPVENPQKNEEKTAKESTTTTIEGDATSKNEVIYKVQILASTKPIKAGDSQFKGLKNCEFYQEGNYYKYTYGNTSSYGEIVKIRKEVVEKFPEAFIIAFHKGKKISLQEAKALTE
ncbi:MAG: N-acetylmuramoyl-L-alanine amidase [Bacteroidales bacterium]|nr:N-acetylmuramoyl-L-alanine amidase [Bacteroidales bacterium]